MNIKRTMLVSMLAMTLPAAHAGVLAPMAEDMEIADTLDYDALTLNYSITDLETVSDDLTGYSAGITRSIHENVFIGVTYQQGSVDAKAGELATGSLATELETASYSVGVGYHRPAMKGMDYVFNLSWVSIEQETLIKIDDTGYSLGIGLRHRFHEDFEYEVAIRHIDVFNDTDTSLALNAGYYLTRDLQLTAAIDAADDRSMSVGLQFFY